MALPDFPIPPELAVDEQPLSDDDLDGYFAVMDAGPNAELRPDGNEDPALAAGVESARHVHAWRIEADDQAEWALRKLAMANEETRRLAEQAQEWERRIRAWFVQAARSPERTAAFMEERLADYALRLRAAGGPASLALPSGTIKTTESKPAVEVADDAALARYLDVVLFGGAPVGVWFDAWSKATEGMDEPLELVKRTPKVYVGPLRKLVKAEERPTGMERWTLTLACDHEVTTEVVAGAEELAVLGDLTACPLCPSDSLDGEQVHPIIAVQREALTELVPVGPDGEVVPGAQVRPGGITPKVEVR